MYYGQRKQTKNGSVKFIICDKEDLRRWNQSVQNTGNKQKQQQQPALYTKTPREISVTRNKHRQTTQFSYTCNVTYTKEIRTCSTGINPTNARFLGLKIKRRTLTSHCGTGGKCTQPA